MLSRLLFFKLIRYLLFGLDKSFFYLCFFFILFNTFFLTTAYSKEQLHIKVGAYDNPPKISIDSKGDVNGFWPDLLAYISNQENWDIQYIPTTWDKALEELRNGDIDVMLDVAFSHKRSEIYAFSGIPVITSWSRVYVKKNNNEIQTILDFNNKKIGGLRGCINMEGPEGLKDLIHSFQLNTTIVEFDTYQEVFKALSDETIDVGIATRDFGDYSSEHYQLERTPIIIQPINMMFAFPKSGELTPLLSKAINNHMISLKKEQNSIYYQLLNKYFEGGITEKQVEILPRMFRRYLPISLGVIIFLLLIIISFRLQLRSITNKIRYQNLKLEESEKQFRFLTENTLDVIWSIDTNLVFTYVNPAIFEFTGYTPEEYVGTNIEQHIDKPTFSLILKTIEKEKSKGPANQGIVIKIELMHKSGSMVPVEINAKVIFDENDTPTGFQGSARDITERVQAENALIESREWFRDIASCSGDWFWQVDQTGRYTYVSGSINSILGYSIKEMIGKTLYDFVSPDEAKRIKYLFSKILDKKGPIVDFEKKIITKNGDKIWLLTNGSPLLNAQGELIGYRGVDKDITKQKVDDEEKRKLEAKLLQAQKMEAIGTLAGGIAHDFNNLLVPIIGFTELVINALPKESDNRRDLNEVLVASHRAQNLISQILKFSREKKADFEYFQIAPIIKECTKLLSSCLPSNIQIRQNITTEPLVVLAEPAQIHQLLMNLGTNAYQAMRNSGGILEINLQKKESSSLPTELHLPYAEYLEIIVSDTGIGMDELTKMRIFDPYFTTKEREGGSGLGLSVVHGIVKSLKGGILVNSKLGEGTCFYIYLPLFWEKTQEEQTTIDDGFYPKGSETILVVDDERPITEMVKKRLESLGYTVLVRTSSIDALELFRHKPEIDLVLTDQTMPDMTGDQLAAEMLRIKPDLPIIICTGYSSVLDEEKARKIGIKSFLMKPVEKNQLAVSIRKALDRES